MKENKDSPQNLFNFGLVKSKLGQLDGEFGANYYLDLAIRAYADKDENGLYMAQYNLG